MFGGPKYYLTLNRDELNKLIKYLTEARNRFIDKDIPTIDVDNALLQIMKLGKHRHKVKLILL